jgi:hypothetical protein
MSETLARLQLHQGPRFGDRHPPYAGMKRIGDRRIWRLERFGRQAG